MWLCQKREHLLQLPVKSMARVLEVPLQLQL
jgi:hypothetical protein